MLAAGYTAVGEFHYLGAAEAFAAAEAAAEAGIAIVLLHVAYERGGLDRMRQPSVAAYLAEVESLRAAGIAVGLAPHSVRACSRDWLEEIGRYAASEQLPLHIHADEQPREIEECLAEHGCRPIELLADTGCLTPRTTIVHATHANDEELDLLAAAGARICACPTTEADLGDGFLRVAAVQRARRSRSASARTRTCGSTRSRSSASSRGSPAARRAGAASSRPTSCSRSARPRAPARCSWRAWAAIEIDVDHRSLAGVAPEHVPAALDRRLRRRRRRRRGAAERDGRDRGDVRRRRRRAVGRAPGARRLLGRVVRPVPRSRSGARGGGRGARRRRRARQGRRRREPGALAARTPSAASRR